MPRQDPWLEDILDLKRTPRTGWFRAGVERPESVADHSFAVGLLAWRRARAEGLDAGKALLMGLLHDFHEARLGDIPSPVKRRMDPEGLAAVEADIVREQWEEWAPEVVALMEELSAGESPEARLVHEADGEELRHQARRYLADGRAGAAEFLPEEERP